jgi:hypothetical protein
VRGTSPAIATPAFSGVPTGTITSSTTTPTMTSVANVASSGTPVLFYQRVGDYVYGTLVLTVTPTAGSTSTQIDFSLPVASNFALTTDLIGSGTTVGATFEPALLFADFTNDRGHIEFTSTSTSTHTVSVTFQYKII